MYCVHAYYQVLFDPKAKHLPFLFPFSFTVVLFAYYTALVEVLVHLFQDVMFVYHE